MAYESPFGKPRGLVGRLADWADRMGKDRSLPWAGLGIIEDLRLMVQVLDKREWLEAMRLSDDPDAQRFARELLADNETVEAAEGAAYNAHHVSDEAADDPVRAIEELDARLVRIRGVLVSTGALADDDTETDLADLLRALLS